MFTVCPGCTRQFQIYAEHLAAASGQVRCGFCHEQFNAMQRLYDEPLTNEEILNKQLALEAESASLPAPEPEPQIEAEPQFVIPDLPETIPEPSIPNEEVLVANNNIDAGNDLETAINEIGIRPSVEEIKAKIKEQSIKEKVEEKIEQKVEEKYEEEAEQKLEQEAVEKRPELIEPINESTSESEYDFPEPEVLVEDEPVKSRWSWVLTLFWTTATFVALLAIILQLAWFNRDRLLMEYPELLPYAKQACVEFDCKLIRQKDVSAIKLVNRDVRLHPDYQDTLLVNAAMINELNVRQPYPRVQLTLFDTSGSLLGYREFVPDDYLDSSIEIEKGMPIDSPVYFVLQVSGPTAGAVSFEFRFL